MYNIISSARFFVAVWAMLFLFSTAHANTFQTRDNRFISYTDVGEGRPIILIHAFPTDKRLWDRPQEELKHFFRVITIDLWGFGQSSSVNGQAISMSEYADEIDQLYDHLNLQRGAIIGGESMGGYVALAFLEQFPDKVHGLILSNTQSIADTPEIKAKREAAAIDVIEHGTEHLRSQFISNALSPSALEKTKLFLNYILEKQDKLAIASALRGMALRHDTSSLLANSSLPILIITGEQDKLISSQQSQNMHELAKNSKLVVFPSAGHLSHLEPPNFRKVVASEF